MAWIKLRHEIHDDLAVVGIACDLNITEDEVVGRLARVWTWFDQQTRDGVARTTTAFVDRIARLPGFSEAMLRHGWLAFDGTSVSLPNFDRHNGDTAKTRGMGAKRQKTWRDKRNAKRNAKTLRGALPEKRREEEIREYGRSADRAADAWEEAASASIVSALALTKAETGRQRAAIAAVVRRASLVHGRDGVVRELLDRALQVRQNGKVRSPIKVWQTSANEVLAVCEQNRSNGNGT